MKITTDAINELFGIRESFELPQVLLKKLLNKQEKDKLCCEFMKFEFDMNNDCLRDYFQMNNANRNGLKQDYTPDCLCKLIGKLAPKTDNVIDICSGTGALSIGFGRDISYRCEELSTMSIPILLFNLALRGMNATVLQKNVLLNKVEKIYKVSRNGKFSDIEVAGSYEDEKTEVVISNPPYSLKWQPRNDERFEGYELAPAKASDYAFVLDGLSRLKENGQAFYILPHGILFRGNSEGKIRKKLVENNLIDAVISLPEKLFLNTSIPVLVLVINKAKKTDDILFISAEKLFEKNGKQNVMTDEHIEKIVGTYRERKSIEKFSSVVSKKEIEYNDFNLNIVRYVDTFEREEIPPFNEIASDLIKSKLESEQATMELVETMKELIGDDEYNKAKDDFVKFFENQDIVGKTMIEWLELQNLEKKCNGILQNAKRQKVQIYEVADFERVKKGKEYDVGTIYIQLSATNGKVRQIFEKRELDTKYGVFMAKKGISSRYLYYLIDFEMPSFLAKYQSGMNINPDIFKYFQVVHFPDLRKQQELAMLLDDIDNSCNRMEKEIGMWEDFKKIHLDGMFL